MKDTFDYAVYTASPTAYDNASLNEFHVSKKIRDMCKFDGSLFASTGNVILANFKNVRLFAKKINDIVLDPIIHPDQAIKAGQLNAMGLIDEIFHYVCGLYRKRENAQVFNELLSALDAEFGADTIDALLTSFCEEFPPSAVYRGEIGIAEYLSAEALDTAVNEMRSNRAATLEELILLHLANENPAFKPFFILFSDEELAKNPAYAQTWDAIQEFFTRQPVFGPNNTDLISMLREPVVFSPNSLKGQLDYIRSHWADLLGEWLLRLLAGMDLISEEEKPGWSPHFGGPPPMDPYNYDSLMKEYERFSPDRDWMPRVVLMAKTVLVWLDQLSKKYNRSITRLDQIPDEELDTLAQEGFTGLWLIGLWERSHASQRIKQICGNPEAAASAYSLYDYDIAQGLGGWDALDNLRRRLWYRGIRLASDMVPNHTGMDSKWITEHPDRFIQSRDCPFPGYTFNGENLSLDGRVSIYLEDHYYSKNDCAVVFKRVDNQTGDTRYIYHGNDGTGMPWNDTAQIDFLNPEAREAVIQEILHVARNFPIIRFDAAMVLAKKHIRRLWYPEPGHGGDIASRAEHAISAQEFDARIPNEFWREVVDRCAQELPDTLLLAEAFWMMEGYFVRTLGMHRVYNSAFMNMLKKEENYKYRSTVKNTIEFDPQVLKRFVNFMNNPDEETAVAQFGKGDKYFGVCTMMVTMPGLPMFGHGQLEGFTEKYGMEFTKAYWNETPDQELLERHKRDIFPLMKKRYLFAEIENFLFYDVWNNGSVNENVFAYTNSFGDERAAVFYNNVYQQASGWIRQSCPYAVKTGPGEKDMQLATRTIGEAFGLHPDGNKFCIFREQHSGLWYIRRSRDICEQGLFIALNGFEYQVLLNITEVTDDQTGKYSTLCDTLAGRGVADIEVALREIFLKELYAAFAAFAETGFFKKLHLFFMPESQRKLQKLKAPKLADIFKESRQEGIDLFNMFITFLEGTYGADTVVNLKKAGTHMPAETAWTQFEQRLTRLAKITAKGAKLCKQTAAAAEPPAAEHTDSSLSADSFVCALYTGMAARPLCAEIVGGYTLLYSLKDIIGSEATDKNVCSLIKLWGLDYKLIQLLDDIVPDGMEQEICQTVRMLQEIIPFCGFELSGKKQQDSLYDILDNLIHDKSAPLLLGTNMFDGVLWFNKERMENALWFLLLTQAVFADKTAGMAQLAAAAELLEEKLAASGYKAELLLELLETPQHKKKRLAQTLLAQKQEEAAAKCKAPAAKDTAKAPARKRTQPNKSAT